MITAVRFLFCGILTIIQGAQGSFNYIPMCTNNTIESTITMYSKMLQVANAKVDQEKEASAFQVINFRGRTTSFYQKLFEKTHKNCLPDKSPVPNSSYPLDPFCPLYAEMEKVCIYNKYYEDIHSIFIEIIHSSSNYDVKYKIQEMSEKMVLHLKELKIEADVAPDPEFSEHGVLIIATYKFNLNSNYLIMNAQQYKKRMTFIHNKVDVDPSFLETKQSIPRITREHVKKAHLLSLKYPNCRKIQKSEFLSHIKSLVARISTFEGGFPFLKRCIVDYTGKLPVFIFYKLWAATDKKYIAVDVNAFSATMVIHELFHTIDKNLNLPFPTIMIDFMKDFWEHAKEFKAVAATNYFRYNNYMKLRITYHPIPDGISHKPLYTLFPKEYGHIASQLITNPGYKLFIPPSIKSYYQIQHIKVLIRRHGNLVIPTSDLKEIEYILQNLEEIDLKHIESIELYELPPKLPDTILFLLIKKFIKPTIEKSGTLDFSIFKSETGNSLQLEKHRSIKNEIIKYFFTKAPKEIQSKTTTLKMWKSDFKHLDELQNLVTKNPDIPIKSIYVDGWKIV